MGKLFLQINLSIDGYIEDTTGAIDWHFTDADFNDFIDRTLLSIDGMIFGRKSFELLAQYWPKAYATDTSEIQVRQMHDLPKYVLSNALEQPDWHNSSVISGDIATKINKLKSEADKDIALFAGAGAASSCAALGLIDEYRLIMNPIQLGGGTRLFDDHFPYAALRLTDVQRFDSGALVSTYRPQIS